MNVNETVGVVSSFYTRGATLSNNSVSSQIKKTEESSLSPSYSINLSSEGLDRSKAQFESRQSHDERAFELRLNQEEAAKSRELESEKKQFDRQQDTEKRRFEAEQRLEQVRFEQQQSF